MEQRSKYDVTLHSRPASNTKYVKAEQRGRQGVVQRYRAGKKPSWRADDDGDDDSDGCGPVLATAAPRPAQTASASDPRLARLAAAQTTLEQQGPRRRVREAVVLEADESTAVDVAPPSRDPPPTGATYAREVGQMQDDLQLRRERAKARAAAEREVELLQREAGPGTTEQPEEEESEYEEVTESESEEKPETRQLAKAVFVRREERLTVLEGRKQEAEQRKDAERLQAIRARRREEAHKVVATSVLKEEDLSARLDEDSDHGDLPDDDDGINASAEYEAWKLRELKRIRRYKEEREKDEAEKLEVERRRLLTDEERKKEDIEYQRMLEKMGLSRERVKWNYMQKYFHKGAYYMDTEEKGMEKEEIFRRDIGAAVGVDKFNKELLPKAMQVRGADFGKKGQSKWTHLTAEDTSMPKDKQGNLTENPFTSITFASKKTTISANQAHQSAENHMMFRNAEPGQIGQRVIGSATYGQRVGPRKDDLVDRPAKRQRR